ncbi:MAG: DsrE family protein [Nitrososphaerales archaeon]
MSSNPLITSCSMVSLRGVLHIREQHGNDGISLNKGLIIFHLRYSTLKRFLIGASYGSEDIERATIPFALANATIKAWNEVVLFLAADAVELIKKGEAEKINAPNFPPLRDLLSNLIKSKVKIITCLPCAKNRNIKPEDAIAGVSFGAGPELATEMSSVDNTVSF